MRFVGTEGVCGFFRNLRTSSRLLLTRVGARMVVCISVRRTIIGCLLFRLFRRAGAMGGLLFRRHLIGVKVPKRGLRGVTGRLRRSGGSVVPYCGGIRTISGAGVHCRRGMTTLLRLGLVDGKLTGSLIGLCRCEGAIRVRTRVGGGLICSLDVKRLTCEEMRKLDVRIDGTLRGLRSAWKFWGSSGVADVSATSPVAVGRKLE